MRILVNRLTAVRQKTGIGHYVEQLLQALRAGAGQDEIIAFPGHAFEAGLHAWKRCKQMLRPRSRSRQTSGTPREGRAWVLSLARSLSAWHFRLSWSWRDFDLYHEPNYIPLPCGRPTVATIHDLSVLLHPQWHPPQRVAYYERHFAQGVQRCSHLLAVSEFTRREVMRHLNVPAEKISRTYNGVRPEMRSLSPADYLPTLARLGLPPRYLLHVGTLEPRKNLLMLLRAYTALPAAVRDRWPLVLVGGWGWNVADLADYFHTHARRQGVVHLGYVGDDDLVALYNGARALLFPSHYEGFGFPALEMLACGGAVLASTADALAEIVGARAHLIDPLDQDGWRHAMLKVTQHDDWWQELRQGAVDAARPFTWECCAADTWAAYRKALGPTALRQAA